MSNANLEIEYKKLNIDDCFKYHYIVPDYQREYVWEDKQIEQLLNDVEGAYISNPDKPYFMGMTVVYGGNSSLELIDGQQRITTFFISLCVLINLYKNNNDKAGIFESRINSPVLEADGTERDAFVLELQYADSADCLNNIFYGVIPGPAELEKLSDSDRRLYNAYTIIQKHLQNEYQEFCELKKFAVYFFHKVQFVQIEAKDISDALKIFETINQRGKGLDSMDLLKNMIFMQVPRDDFKSLNTQWKAINDKIASIDEKPLRFLRYFITATYDISDETGTIKGILPEDKIYDWLMQNNLQCQYGNNPFGFVGILTDGINRYIKFLSPNKIDKGNEYLFNISRIAGSSYKSHLVLLLAANKMSDDALANFKQLLEAIIYYATVNHIKGNETEKLFANWCPKIRLIKNKEDLIKFAKEDIIPQIDKWRSDKNYHLNFMTLNAKTTQLYRIRFILSRLTKYVDDVRGGGKNYADIDKCYDAQYQIEHIMPQKCTDMASYDVSEEEFSYIDNQLGNLTLLEKSFNAACQNADYKTKCSIYPQSSFYLTSALPILENVGKNTAANSLNERLQSWDKWNKQTINERQEMLFKLAEKIWDMEEMINSWS